MSCECTMKTFHTSCGSFLSLNTDKDIVPYLQSGSIPRQKIIEKHLQEYITQACTIINVGSKIGAVDVFFATLNTSISIYSFEPRDTYFEILCRNIGLNNCENVTMLNAVPGHKTGRMKVPRSYYENACEQEDIIELGNGGLIADNDYFNFATLDSLNLMSCDIIYVDLHDFEYLVVMGGMNTIRKFKPVICFFKNVSNEGKLLSTLNISENQVADALNKLGYEINEVEAGCFIANAYKEVV